MKLSEMSTEKAFDAMVKMLPYAVSIAEDAELKETKEHIKEKRDSLTNGKLMALVIPAVADKHRDDVFSIVAILEGTDKESVSKKPFGETMAAFDSAWEDIMGFFPVCLRLTVSA